MNDFSHDVRTSVVGKERLFSSLIYDLKMGFICGNLDGWNKGVN